MNAGSRGNSHAPDNDAAIEVRRIRSISKPLILGHRGSPRESLENTLSSFDRAVREGADGVELDVRGAIDGVPVVIHDDSMDRALGVPGLISALAWPAVQKLSGARVPSFEQVAAWAAASGAWLNVELKTMGVEAAVLELIHRVGISERVIFSSFEPAIVRRVGELDGSVLRFFLTERWDERARQGFHEGQATGVCLQDDGAEDRALRELREGGVPVIVWTVNRPARVRRLLESGVAGIISDLPGMAARERDSYLQLR